MNGEDDHLALAFPQKPFGVVRAAGAHLWTEDGRRLVDLGGASHGVANLGHCHPRIVQAVREQAALLIHCVATVRSPERARFLERLHRLLPERLTRTFLTNSGAEACEAALKYAYAATGRTKVVAATQGFHGRTLGALATTHRPPYRRPFEPILRETTFVAYNDAEAIAQAVDSETAAVVLEPVQGEGGLTVASREFLRGAQDAARDAGALLVIDEVQTGMGRTGRDLAIERSGIEPDLILLGKSLAGGLPVGAASMTEEVARAMAPGGHGSTFGGGPLVCAAAAAALDVLVEERLAQRAERVGRWFRERLEAIGSPIVRQVRGEGLMLGVEMRIKPHAVLERLAEAGFLALPAGSTVVRFLPPLTISRRDLSRAAARLEEILADPALAPRVTVEAR